MSNKGGGGNPVRIKSLRVAMGGAEAEEVKLPQHGELEDNFSIFGAFVSGSAPQRPLRQTRQNEKCEGRTFHLGGGGGVVSGSDPQRPLRQSPPKMKSLRFKLFMLGPPKQ